MDDEREVWISRSAACAGHGDLFLLPAGNASVLMAMGGQIPTTGRCGGNLRFFGQARCGSAGNVITLKRLTFGPDWSASSRGHHCHGLIKQSNEDPNCLSAFSLARYGYDDGEGEASPTCPEYSAERWHVVADCCAPKKGVELVAPRGSTPEPDGARSTCEPGADFY